MEFQWRRREIFGEYWQKEINKSLDVVSLSQRAGFIYDAEKLSWFELRRSVGADGPGWYHS